MLGLLGTLAVAFLGARQTPAQRQAAAAARQADAAQRRADAAQRAAERSGRDAAQQRAAAAATAAAEARARATAAQATAAAAPALVVPDRRAERQAAQAARQAERQQTREQRQATRQQAQATRQQTRTERQAAQAQTHADKKQARLEKKQLRSGKTVNIPPKDIPGVTAIDNQHKKSKEDIARAKAKLAKKRALQQRLRAVKNQAEREALLAEARAAGFKVAVGRGKATRLKGFLGNIFEDITGATDSSMPTADAGAYVSEPISPSYAMLPPPATASAPTGYEKRKAKGRLRPIDMFYELSQTTQQQLFFLINEIMSMQRELMALLQELQQPIYDEGPGYVEPYPTDPYGVQPDPYAMQPFDQGGVIYSPMDPAGGYPTDYQPGGFPISVDQGYGASISPMEYGGGLEPMFDAGEGGGGFPMTTIDEEGYATPPPPVHTCTYCLCARAPAGRE